jgi:hypothetical protein
MHCTNCGILLPEAAFFCNNCGAASSISAQAHATSSDETHSVGSQLVGFSARINDPSFLKYSKSMSRWSFISLLILAIALIIGFPIYGGITGEIDPPYSLYYGIGLGAIFAAFALYQQIKIKLDTTWDGTIVNKESSRKTSYNRNMKRYTSYTEHVLLVKRTDGKVIRDVVAKSSAVYDYYNIGDRVRHHKGFYAYEKYDKSGDYNILCIACLTINEIKNDWCSNCKCALLK